MPWLDCAENCGVYAVAVLVGVVQFPDKVVARWCNDCRSRNAWYDYGYMLSPRVAFGRIFTFFPRDGVDSAPELDSRPALLAGTSSTTAVACSLMVLLV